MASTAQYGSGTEVLRLDDERARDPALVGEKAAVLARLRAEGFPVPDGLVIPAAAAGGSIPAVAASVEAAWRSLGSPPVAVRSSATAEDLAGASFAGLYETHLNVRDLDRILECVSAVWASFDAPHAVDYRARTGSPGGGGMAVLIQPLVAASAAGVCFTCDPRTGDGSRFVVNVAPGLGEGVVDGTVPTDTFVLDSRTWDIVESTVAEKTSAIFPLAEGDVAAHAIDEDETTKPALSPEALSRLAEVATRVRDLFRDERDIEFAFDEAGTLHLLQARPITGLPQPPQTDDAFPVEWDDPADALDHWLRKWPQQSAMPRLQQDALLAADRWNDALFEEIGPILPMTQLYGARFFHGYGYARARDTTEQDARLRFQTVLDRIDSFLDKGTTLFRVETEPRVRAVLDRLEPGRRRRSPSLVQRFEHLAAAIEAFGEVWGYLHFRQTGRHLFTRDELPDLYREIIGDPAASAADLLVGLDHHTARLMRRLRGLAQLAASDPRLLAAIERSEPHALRMRSLSTRPVGRRFRRRFRDMLAVYGRRSGQGFGSSVEWGGPTWNMDPSIPLAIVADLARHDLRELERREAAARARRRRLLRRARRRAASDPRLLARFERALFAATEEIRFMEDHNYLMEQCTFGTLYEAINALGHALVDAGQLAQPSDINHCALEELEAVCVRGEATDLAGLVAERRRQLEYQRDLRPPPSLGRGRPPRFIATPPGTSASEDPPKSGLSDGVLSGQAASGGKAEGRARVIQPGTRRLPAFEPGDVLVARNAGPDWTPAFPMLAGLVLDQGAIFQHAALIARECLLPAVIRTREGTAVIKEGQRLLVDGDAGIVRLLS